jgi:hypothetical protein
VRATLTSTVALWAGCLLVLICIAGVVSTLGGLSLVMRLGDSSLSLCSDTDAKGFLDADDRGHENRAWHGPLCENAVANAPCESGARN